MRLLILTQYFPPEVGAPQARLSAIARELVRAGHQVEILTALPNHPTGRIFPSYRVRPYCRELHEGIPVHRVWLYPSTGAGAKRLLNYASFAAAATVGLMNAGRPDYLFVESPPVSLALPALLARALWKVPFILNISDLWLDAVRELGMIGDGWAWRIAERFERLVYRKAAYVNAVTDGMRATLIQRKGVPEDRVLFLPNGVDNELYKAAPPDQGLVHGLGLEGKQIVLYGGTHGYAHGLESVLRAAKLLSHDSAIHFLFVGDGSEKPNLRTLARTLALNNVTFLDPVPPQQMVRFLSIACCGVVPQRDVPLFQGNRPAKLFSIMACAKPVVFAGRGEGARLVEHARAGVIVAPEDAQALAHAIQALASDPPRASELGANGRTYVAEKFSWSRTVQSWLVQLEERRATEQRRTSTTTMSPGQR